MIGNDVRIVQQTPDCFHLYIGTHDCWLNRRQLADCRRLAECLIGREAPNFAHTARTEAEAGSYTENGRKPDTGEIQQKQDRMITFECIGNLAEDARVIPNNGKPFISFHVGVTRRYKTQQGERAERTTWVDCTRSGDGAFAKYLTKGRQVYVRGDIEARAYADKEGRPAAALSCHVQDVQLLGGKPKEDEGRPKADEDALPF